MLRRLKSRLEDSPLSVGSPEVPRMAGPWLGGSYLRRLQTRCLLLPETDTRWRHDQGPGHQSGQVGGSADRTLQVGSHHSRSVPVSHLPLPPPQSRDFSVTGGSTALARTSSWLLPGLQEAATCSWDTQTPSPPDTQPPRQRHHAQARQRVRSLVPEEPSTKGSNLGGRGGGGESPRCGQV